MTGEITLRGRILPVGGVREKVLAAHRAGLKTVLMPKRNLKDLVDVPKRARSEMNIVPVEHMDQVLSIALAAEKEKATLLRKRANSEQEKRKEESRKSADSPPPMSGESIPAPPGT
jgi:ATP-dependent Lon protease